MKSLNLNQEHFQNKPKPPAIIKPQEIRNIPGVKGVLPLRAGEVILTPEEATRLRSLGWKPGDPIPGNLPEYLKAFDRASRQLPEEIRQEILTTPSAPPGTPPTRIPQPIDISQLDEAKRAEIESYLNEFKKHAPQIEQAVKARGGIDKMAPSIQKAIIAAEDEGIEVVDSRSEKIAVDEVLGTQFASAGELQRKIDIAEGKKDSDAIKEDIPKEDADPIDYLDKVNYLTAVIAMKPFCKTYSLFGNNVKITYRQLPTERADMIVKQVRYAAREGSLLPAESVDAGHLYWALLSLSTIFVGDTCTRVDKFVDDFIEKWDGNTQELLPNLADMLKQVEPTNNASVWRAIKDCYTKFVRLTEQLEAKADDADFWKGIEV